MLAFLIGAAVMDGMTPDVSSEPCPTPLPDAPGAIIPPAPLPLVTSAPVAAKLANVGSAATNLVDSSVPYYQTFNEQGKRVDIPPKIIARWAYHESAMKPRAARYEPHLNMWSRGIAQFLESTWREWAAAYGYSWSDAYDPEKSIRVMADYLWYSRSVVAASGMTEKQIVELMLAGYNAGPYTAKRKGLSAVNASVRAKIRDTVSYAGY
tara:strand:+ start:966 stop:1592 length:627 start_codon:yes stop_codon:yes gene_type:complete